MAGRGLLILGPSGAGKSRLAVAMIALGAGLIADDQVRLTPRNGQVWLSAPAPTRGMIEARGLGLLACPAVGSVALQAVLDLARPEPDRLPDPARIRILDRDFPLIGTPLQGHDASALMLYMRYGMRA